MITERRDSCRDIDGAPVGLGDWVEVFCSWTQQPKFDGRAVQVIELLKGGTGTVFRVRDPSLDLDISHFYVVADGHGYRRVNEPPALN
ncbi:MAG: hypothetical protein JWN48_3442 [Myxococcaceae bacterium]|nr:hypothetical protein [Myxococcaceae bacterium]